MKALEKLRNNVLTVRAVEVLGPIQYASYLATFMTSMPSVVRRGDLTPVDAAMGKRAHRFTYRDRSFIFDCAHCDRAIRDGTYAFGVVREIYIRDCYFRWQPRSVYSEAKTVVDLGANRGAFSVLMAGTGAFVLSVEAQGQFLPVITHNMARNGYTNFAVEEAFVGSGGTMDATASAHVSIDTLLDRHGLASVDFMKMDIEGSEFALFAEPAWMDRVRAISMEVHPAHGRIGMLVDTLGARGFHHAMADENLDRVTSPERASFLYAWKADASAAVGARSA